MTLWLRQLHIETAGHASTDDGAPMCGVGVEDDIIRRENFGTVVQLDQALCALQRQRDGLLADAHKRSDALLAKATEDAATLREQAQRLYDTAEQRGYAAGEARALGDWHQRTARIAADQKAMQSVMRERLAELVVLAVDRIVRTEDPAVLFEKAAGTIERIIDSGSHLTVRVHPEQHDKASHAFAYAARSWQERGHPVALHVVADSALAPGSCICESPLGVIDASLETQLNAVRAATARAMASLPIDAADGATGSPASAVDDAPNSLDIEVRA